MNLTDRPLGLARDVTGEHRSKAALVLASVARALAAEQPDTPLESLKFHTLVGVRAYDQAGRSCHGGGLNVSRMALTAVAERTGLAQGEVPDGVTHGVFAVEVAQAARALGYDWSADDNQPAIPHLPCPRRSEESGRVPAPRPEQGASR